MKKSFFLLMVMFMFLFLGTSCTTYHFGVPDRAAGVPAAFGETEVAIAQAEQSQGAKYCPEKIVRAKELAKKGAETYWACRTDEAMDLLAEARQLAKRRNPVSRLQGQPHRHHHPHHLNLHHRLRRHHRLRSSRSASTRCTLTSTSRH